MYSLYSSLENFGSIFSNLETLAFYQGSNLKRSKFLEYDPFSCNKLLMRLPLFHIPPFMSRYYNRSFSKIIWIFL